MRETSFVPDDVLLNKAAIIRRCLDRVREEYRSDPARLNILTVQDSIILNLQRACEASIDLAMHLVAKHKLGIAQDARHAFEMLQSAGWLDENLAQKLKSMVGFRNVAVHEYQSLNLEIVRVIVERHLQDFEDFLQRLFAAHP